MKQKTKKPLRLRRSIRVGIKVAVFILTVLGTVEAARIGWNAFQNRTGLPGGEVLILPLIILLFYTGWTARKEWDEFKREFKANGGRDYANSSESTAAFKR